MAKVSRAYIKGTGVDQSGSIQPGSTIYAQDILDLIDSAKWHDEGIESVYYDYENNGIKVVKSSDPGNPVFISVPRNSDIVNKLVKGVDKYELHSDSGLVSKTDLPSTLVTSVACDKDANELQVSSTSSDSGITVPLPDSLKSVAIEGNTLTFTSLDGTPTTIDLPDSLKSVTIEGNELTFTSLDGVPSTIDLPITTGYLSDVSFADGTITFTKEGASDVNVTLPFISKAITGVSLQGSNLVFTFSDDTEANIALPTQSEEGTTAGLLSGVRIDGNKMIFTVSGGNDITIELPSTSGGSGDVDLTGLLYEPCYSAGHLYFKAKGSNSLTDVWLDGISKITEVSNDNLYYNDIHDNLHRVSLSSLTSGVLTGASLSDDNLVFTAKDSDNVSIPLADLTASGVLTGVRRVGEGVIFTVKGSVNDLFIPLSSAVQSVTIDGYDKKLVVGYSDYSKEYSILPKYLDTVPSPYAEHYYGWGGSLAYSNNDDYDAESYTPLWVPTRLSYMGDVLESSFDFPEIRHISIGSSSPEYVGLGYIKGNHYVSTVGEYIGDSSADITILYCTTPFSESFSESSGTFTANVLTDGRNSNDYVLISSSINFALNGNILEAFPEKDTVSFIHLLKSSSGLSNFKGFAFVTGSFVVLIDKDMFFAKKVYDWSYHPDNSFGLRVYLGKTFEKNFSYVPFYGQAGKVLD